MQVELPRYNEIIQAGIQKLQQYRERLTMVPAYTLSICKSYNLCSHKPTIHNQFSNQPNYEAKLVPSEHPRSSRGGPRTVYYSCLFST